jgi:hypothetical protein
MSIKIVDTVIIGAGISGLACAKKLQDNDRNFIIVTENIGGRILTSKDGTKNYGAFFVCSDYYHFLQHIKIKSRIKLSDFCFHNDKTYVLFEPLLLTYAFQFIKTIKILLRFRRHFRFFRKICEHVSQKKAIESDPFLYELYMQNAADFVKIHNLQTGVQRYLSHALYSTTFSQIKDMNAFSFLEFLMPLITPIYTFTFNQEKMIEPYKERIMIGSVKNITHKSEIYKISFNENIIKAKNVVLATEIVWSKDFAGVKKINRPVSTNMLHIKGVPTTTFSKKLYNLFMPPSPVQALADLKDGTYLLYYQGERPSLDEFFKDPKIIAHHYWNPVGTINGHNLIESNRGNNLYLIGDYNVAGLEDAYITGIYAANQILMRK